VTIARFARARALGAFDHADTLTLLGDDGSIRRFSGDSAQLARAILAFAAAPCTREALAAHLTDLAGTPVTLTGTVEETLAHLEAAGALREAPARPLLDPAPTRATRVVLGVAGAVSAALVPSLVMILQARGFTVRVATTRNALRFVAPLALEALTHAPVVTSLWPREPTAPVPHLDLARWADVMVVCPATATTLARLASGNCGTVVTAAAIATRAPVLVVPSMNDAMYAAPSVQRNLAVLRDDGFSLAHPACGLEVADAPPDRVPRLGPAPPADIIANLIQIVAREHAASSRPPAPAWDEMYRKPPGDLPWFTDTLDPDIADLLGAPAPGASHLLDLGTGLGTAAIAAADRGYRVVATDLSPRAIDLARARAGARAIAWIVDDILATRLRGTFDVALDRGLCHVLPAADRTRYAAAVRDLLRPGGRLLLKCHSAAEPDDHGAHRFTRDDIAALFGGGFDLVRVEDTTFPGPARAPRALLCTLVRR
jgi:hypothetical protein